jgi:hypothetical protein
MKKYNQGVADSNRRRARHGATADARQGRVDPLYKVWSGMKARCLNPNAEHFHRYGGRGITVHPAWAEDFAAFRDYIGPRPKGATLERIDNDEGYVPGNLRWATRKEQANNRNTSVLITHLGETRSLMEWADHLGWKYGLIASRWKKGLRGDELFAPPKHERNKLHTYEGKTMTMPKWSEETGIPYATLVWRLKRGKPLFSPHTHDTNEE